MSIEKPQKVIKKVVEKTTELFGGILSNHLDLKPLYPQTIIVNISPIRHYEPTSKNP
jgi:hypothetical protein